MRAIEFLMAPKRETVGEQTKAQLLIKQAYQCANCGTCLISAAAEIDHEPRIHESAEQTLSYLCHQCHREKSSQELSVGNSFSIQSRFSPHAVTYFRNQRPTPPLVLHISNSPGKGCTETWQTDIIKCRAECWKYSSSDYSIFCCLDSIHRRTDCTLADW